LIASTEECDGLLLDQVDLDVHYEPVKDSPSRGLSNTLGNLLKRVQTRHFGQSANLLADWTTTQLTLTTMAPPKQVRVPESGKAVHLSDAVRLLPHSFAGRDFGCRPRAHPSTTVSLPGGLPLHRDSA